MSVKKRRTDVNLCLELIRETIISDDHYIEIVVGTMRYKASVLNIGSKSFKVFLMRYVMYNLSELWFEYTFSTQTTLYRGSSIATLYRGSSIAIDQKSWMNLLRNQKQYRIKRHTTLKEYIPDELVEIINQYVTFDFYHLLKDIVYD